MFCRQCGTCLPQDSRFCPACGVPTDAAPNQNSTAGASAVAGVPCYFIPVQPVSAYAPLNDNASVLQTPDTAAAPGAAPAYLRNKADLHSEKFRIDEPADCRNTDAAFSDGTDAPLAVWQTLLSLVALLYLPVGNILFACIWAFGEKAHPTRRSMARAALPLIALSLLALFGVLVFLSLNLRGFSMTFR